MAPRKSMPRCGARASPLNTLRTPNTEITSPSTGLPNPSSQRCRGETADSTRFSRSRSRSMRACSAGGGVTNSGATLSRRVANVLAATFSASLPVISAPSAWRALASTEAGPGRTARSMPTSACQVDGLAPGYPVKGCPNAVPRTAVSGAAAVKVSSTASPGTSARAEYSMVTRRGEASRWRPAAAAVSASATATSAAAGAAIRHV